MGKLWVLSNGEIGESGEVGETIECGEIGGNGEIGEGGEGGESGEIGEIGEGGENGVWFVSSDQWLVKGWNWRNWWKLAKNPVRWIWMKAVRIGRNKSDRAKAVVFMKERVITYPRRESCED